MRSDETNDRAACVLGASEKRLTAPARRSEWVYFDVRFTGGLTVARAPKASRGSGAFVALPGNHSRASASRHQCRPSQPGLSQSLSASSKYARPNVSSVVGVRRGFTPTRPGVRADTRLA
jgi:hypothetical protein